MVFSGSQPANAVPPIPQTVTESVESEVAAEKG